MVEESKETPTGGAGTKEIVHATSEALLMEAHQAPPVEPHETHLNADPTALEPGSDSSDVSSNIPLDFFTSGMT